MPLHILLPFAVFAIVMVLMAMILLSVFFICRQRKHCRTGLLDSDLGGTHNVFTSSLLSIDKDEFIESIQPKMSSKHWSGPPHSSADSESRSSLVSTTLMPTSSFDTLSLKSDVGTLVPTLYQKKGTILRADSGVEEAQRRGKLCFRVSYDFKTSDLIVVVKEARDLVFRRADTINAFVRLTIEPAVDERKRQTSTAWTSYSPVFQEEFKFPLAHERISDYRLDLQVFHRVRPNEVVLLGWMELPLSVIDVTADMEVWGDVLDPQTRVNHEWGQLLISLNYLPSAKRLTLGVVRARQLRVNESQKVKPDTCCKAVLKIDDRVVKRKHTSTKKGTSEPEWNEAIVFHDLAPEDLPSASIQINVVDSNSIFRQSHVLGTVQLGPNCPGQGAEHWHDMKISERKNVSIWHPLIRPELLP